MSEPHSIDIDGHCIAFRLTEGSAPTLVFLPGFASDMEGAKAVAIDAFAAANGLGCLRFDYSGTGSSGGEFAEGTLALWLDQALAMTDRVTQGPLILVGSSMGGWIALHLALRRPERIAALVGIAAAPDFTEWGFGEEQRRILLRDAMIGPETHRIHRAFWESGQALRLLGNEIAVDCPIRLIHGQDDRDVPLDLAFRLVQALRSADVQLSVIKGGSHRLSEPREITAILRTVAGLLEPNP